MSTPPLVPPLFTGLVDDAAVFPPGSATLTDAVAEHRTHRAAWYADLVGPLLVPATEVGRVTGPLTVAVIGDAGIDGLATTVDKVSAAGLTVAQVEVPVAKRGEDPQPGLARLRQLAGELRVYAEIPLTWGLLGALDTVAEARAAGLRLAPKFRTGGLAAELFPTPVELAAVICACRDRQLPFKLTAGLHHAVRHTDPETGFTHHGFLNVLAGTLLAAEGAEVAAVAELLGATHPLPLVEAARVHRLDERPLWVGFGSCSVVEPLADLVRLGLVNGGAE